MSIALELDQALTAWLSARPAQAETRLLRAPWPRRLRAVDAFIAGQAGELTELTADSYRGIRLICAMLLQRMDRAEPMSLESFVVHVLSANIADMSRAAVWGEVDADRFERLPQVVKALGPLRLALAYAPPLEQPGLGIWRN